MSKLQLASIGLFLENTFSALKCNFLNAHMGYIPPFIVKISLNSAAWK